MTIYTPNTPQATQTIAFTQPLIESNFTYLPIWSNVDHYFASDDTDTNDGFHKKVTFKNTIAAPGFGTGVCDLYAGILNTEVSLKFENASGFWSITGIKPVPAQTGYTSLAGGIILQWGFVAKNWSGSNQSEPVAFPLVFPNNTYNIQLTLQSTGTDKVGSIQVFTTGITTAGFNVNFNSDQTTSSFRNIYWMAIGN